MLSPIIKCSICNADIQRNRLGPVPLYCSSACRQKAFRKKKLSQGFSILHGYYYKVYSKNLEIVIRIEQTDLTGSITL